MRQSWAPRVLKFVVFGAAAIAVAGFVVMNLWNWLMPALFGLRAITFGQALGMLILSRILLGGFRGGRGRTHWRHRMGERWSQMTPEEREKFAAGLQHRCGRTARTAEPAL